MPSEKLLLDTCAVLWLAEPERLSSRAQNAIRHSPLALFVSAISAFEIGIKARKGKIDLGRDVRSWWSNILDRHGVKVIPISDEIALASTALPTLHRDPCDRIIVATAAVLEMAIITSDRLIEQYPQARVIW